jgi:type I restriction enzyme R subunit
MKFTEAQLEEAILELLAEQGYPHVLGEAISDRPPEAVLIEADLRQFLATRYAEDGITAGEITSILRRIERLPGSDLYDSNKAFLKLVSDGFLLKREDRSAKDIFIHLIDYSTADVNIYKAVNQLEITGFEKRIPDGLLYINGLPLVVFEFKTAIQEKTTIHDAWKQLAVRYRRDIPELLKYNAFCVISDGVNNKMGSIFTDYEFFYAWRKITGDERIEKDGIDSLFTMIHGLFDKDRLRDVIRNFIYFPDSSKKEEKIVCRYPQYYGARKLFDNIRRHRKPEGDGKGGTYFGATGCGKSFLMLFLSRLLMKSEDFASPTLVLITDRTDLDDQLSKQFTNAKGFIGDEEIISVESRSELRARLGGRLDETRRLTWASDESVETAQEKLLSLVAEAPASYGVKGRASGGVFLTTIHKFTEDTQLLSDRSNVICISDEAHRSQVNLDQKIRITEQGVQTTFGFAKYLHDSLPNATYVGVTGTPIDATLSVFGDVVDAYTMEESVRDEITVRIVYEGRAAKILLDNAKLKEIENYYKKCAEDGATVYAVEESKRANAQMNSILGDPGRLKALADDFVKHYEKRMEEGASVKGKAMFVCSSREIAWELYKNVIALRPEWAEMKVCEEGADLTEKEKREIKPMERIKMVMTRGPDDEQALWDILSTKEYRKELDRQFKTEKSNFKIAVVVDMWLTGFDVPFLDTIYIDKPIKRHNLIQTISRVNRKFAGKEKGLVVDYIGIKTQMNLAMAQYGNAAGGMSIEEIDQTVVVVKDHLDLLGKLFHKLDTSDYFSGKPLKQLHCLNMAAEFAQLTEDLEKRFMFLTKRMKASYDLCCHSEKLSQSDRDHVHFYLAVRSIVYKLTKGEAPDLAQMNAKVREMIAEALKSDGVEEIFKLGSEDESEVDLFDEDYLNKIRKIKLPNTKVKLLQKLLKKAIENFKKVNKAKGSDFAKMFQKLVEKYNERKEEDVLVSNVLDDFADEIVDLLEALKKEKESFADLGIDFEEKAFFDILKAIAIKYDFEYPDEKLIPLSKAVKQVVDDKAKYTDWSHRDDIKAELKVDLIMLLAENGYPPITHDDVYKEIFEQAENFKKYRGA